MSGRAWARIGLLLLVLLAINWAVVSALLGPGAHTHVAYTSFLLEAQAANIDEVTTAGNTIDGTYRSPVDGVERFSTVRPSFATDNIFALLQANGAAINPRPPASAPLILRVGPALLLVALIVWALHHFRYARSRVTFADVVMSPSVSRELTDVVEWLRNPARHRRLGAHVPRGVLLSGPPGTGKTLLARAVAGEAGVPFVRAGTHWPVPRRAVVFMDDLDRSTGQPAASEVGWMVERLLGRFAGRRGVVVLAAVDGPVDAALAGPGRFERHVVIDLPEAADREQILTAAVRGVPIGADVRLGELAASTSGMSGEDLCHLVNEAALLAAREERESVTAGDFVLALSRLRGL